MVREEVESLLNHHSRAGSFLNEPVPASVPALLDEEEAVAVGTVIGHYTVVRELGRGAMGRVYLARDSRLGRQVALKALAPHLTGDPSHRERLKREARAAAGLAHSGICTVYALEEIDGYLFIASELVDGQTLREEIVRDRQPSADAILATARELAEALASAHGKGITHRDFKPENVMRDRTGRLKVLDFGLARTTHALTPLSSSPAGALATLPGLLVGTPAYMSPEQLNGQPADPRADVFAFGVVLLRVCVRRPSVRGVNAARSRRSRARKRCEACGGQLPSHPAPRCRCGRPLSAEVTGRTIRDGGRDRAGARVRGRS